MTDKARQKIMAVFAMTPKDRHDALRKFSDEELEAYGEEWLSRNPIDTAKMMSEIRTRMKIMTTGGYHE